MVTRKELYARSAASKKHSMSIMPVSDTSAKKMQSIRNAYAKKTRMPRLRTK